MFGAMLKRGLMYAGIGAAAGAALGAGSAYMQRKNGTGDSENNRKNLGMSAPSLAQYDELYEATVQMRQLIAAVEISNRNNKRYTNAPGEQTAAQLYVILVQTLERMCALELDRGSDGTYKAGLANKSLRYVQTTRALLAALETMLRRATPTAIAEFQETRDALENGVGDLYHNLSVQELIEMENSAPPPPQR